MTATLTPEHPPQSDIDAATRRRALDGVGRCIARILEGIGRDHERCFKAICRRSRRCRGLACAAGFEGDGDETEAGPVR